MIVTAVEWLFDQMVEHHGIPPMNIIREAIAMEKEQMSGSYTEGFKRAAYIRDLISQHLNDWNEGIPDDFETYYQKNYADNG